ncbi:MAG: IS21 family transposase [Deltaproteobacteria bacterium]|jgi:transposase|nr:IS21 family transposase [Deltaproteobacteria bacterium]
MPLYIANREELELLIVTMHAEGWSIHALSRRFKIGRNTVRRILRKNERNRKDSVDLPTRKLPRKSRLDPYMPRIQTLLEQFPDITGLRMFEELRDAGYDGGITILRDRLRSVRKRPKRDPVVRFETDPGFQGQMDWSPYAIPFTRGGKTKVLCFSYVLGFSRRQYIDFTLHRDFHTLIRRHRDAFEHFGGVPRQCLYDGEKTVILRWEAGRPVFNPAFVAFITHYWCKPVACPRGRPQTKGKVEKPFQFIENNLLNARRFQDMDDLKATARWWLGEKSDPHLHETTNRIVLDLFLEQEASALQPLPLHPYDCSQVALRVCTVEGFVEFDTNFYSVPYECIGDILTFKAAEHEIFIYSQELDLVARHERLPLGAAQKSEKPEHRCHPKVRYGLEPVKESFMAFGDGAQLFLTGLKGKNPRNCGFHARFILQLKEKYTCSDINSALAHAARYQAFDGRSVERILAANATPRTLESIRNDQARDTLQKALPQIKQRPLEEYSSLLTGGRDGRHDKNDPELSRDAQTLPHGKSP